MQSLEIIGLQSHALATTITSLMNRIMNYVLYLLEGAN